MGEFHGNHAVTTPVGVLTVAMWAIFGFIAVVSLPAVPLWVLITTLLGIAACLGVALNFRHWLVTALIASSLYLLFDLTRILLSASKFADALKGSFFSGLSLHYWAAWRLITHNFQNAGIWEGLGLLFLDILMPLLNLTLLAMLIRHRFKLSAAIAG